MDNLICGFLYIKRKKYYFTFDDNSKILTIQPPKLEKYPSFIKEWDLDNHPYLKGNIDIEGYTINNCYIKFINVNFKSIRWGCFRTFVPAYIIAETNAIKSKLKPTKIYKMSFTGKAIDLLVNPRKYVKDESLDITNEMILKAANMEGKEITSSYTYNKKKYKIIFSPSYKVTTIHKDITRVLDLFSVLSIEGDKFLNINEILDLYILIERLLSFTNHRKRVDFDEILLFQKEKVKFDSQIYNETIVFKLVVSRNNEEIILPNKIDNVIQIEEIIDHLQPVLDNLLEDDFLLLPFPTSNNDSHIVNNDRFLDVSASFECEISAIHDDFKAEKDKNYKMAKDTLQTFLNSCLNDKKYNSDTRRTFQYFYGEIEKMDGSLQDKILHYLKEYEEIFRFDIEYLKNVKKMKDLKLENIAKSFADRRNYMSHGKKLERYDSLQTVSFVIVMKLCYILFLKRSGFSDNEINAIIDKVFK